MHPIFLAWGWTLLVTACGERAPVKVETGSSDGESTDDSGSSSPGTIDLVRAEDWARLAKRLDSFPDHRPDEIECDSDGWHPEAGVLEVETNNCNYASLVQSSRASVVSGDTVDLLVYHSALSALEPAEAHVAVLLDGETLWEETIPIPSASEIYDISIVPTRDVPAGSPVVLHLHNHGGNAWKLGHLRRVRD